MPEATLGISVKSEREWRPLMRRWVLGTPEERAALESQLIAFGERYRGDPLVRLELVLRAFNALERGELDRAEALVRQKGEGDRGSPLFGNPGTTRDLANLVIGAVDRRKGRHKAALTRMRPLLHKMLDDFATTLLDEELVHSAIGARSWVEAVLYMEVWQREAEPGHEREVAEQIKALLTRVPRKMLLTALDQRAADGRIESDRDTAQLIAQQLAVVVVASRDAVLARTILDRYGALLGDYGEAVARLAVDTTRGRVQGSTVGLLLSLRTDALRRRSADVVAGVAFGLGLPGSQARLVTRDEGKNEADVRVALAALASDGAAVIVAGVDPEHNGAVTAFARDESLPVLLVTPDPSGVAQSSPFVFLLGNEVEDTVGLLARRLRDDGATAVASLGEPLAPTRSPSIDLEAPCNDAALELRNKGIDALVIVDGAHCEDSAGDALAKMRVGVGLGVASLDGPPARAQLLSAGVFPVDTSRPDKRLAAWLDAGRGAPGWWSAIGRDAAVLALSAVENLRESGTDAGEVKARRVEATSALLAARATLWTSEAAGFDGAQRLPRTITVEVAR